MKKLLLFILALCVGFSAYAQMATTYKVGQEGSRLVSNDERNICFRSRAKKLYADLDPATHNRTNLNQDSNNPVQISYQQNGLDMGLWYSNFGGVTEIVNGQAVTHQPSASYSFSNGVGTFAYNYVGGGNAAINLMDGLSGKLGDYENFVVRTLEVTSPLNNQTITISTPNGNVQFAQGARYCLQFCNSGNSVIRQIYIYSNDVKVIHLKEFFSDSQINSINSIWLSTAGGYTNLSGSVSVAECYFISAYNMNNEAYFKDMDDKYIGNAYIHPSYFICSNGVSIDETTGRLSVEKQDVYRTLDNSYYHRWTTTDASAEIAKDDNNHEITAPNITNFDNKIGSSVAQGATVFGTGSVYYLDYADLDVFDKMIINFTGDLHPMLRFGRLTDNGDELTSIDDNTNPLVTETSNGSIKTWTIDLNALKESRDDGFAHLNSIKACWGSGSLTVNSVQMVRYNSLDRPAKIQLSVPFEGFDMSDITVVTFDNEEDGDCIWRNIYGYLDYDKQGRVHKGTNDDMFLSGGDENPHDVRTLYTSRYNADFGANLVDQNYIKKINNIYWETNFVTTDNPIEDMTVNDICFTKNHVVARNGGNHTLLSNRLFKGHNESGEVTNENEGCTPIGTTGGLLYGNGNVKWYAYADLSEFYKMQIKGSPGKQVRLVYNRKPGEGDSDGGEYKEIFVRLDAKGLAVVDMKALMISDPEQNYFHLNSIKDPDNTGSTCIDYIKLYSEEDGIVKFNQDMYHTWNRAENGTVTRKDAFGSSYINHIGDGSTLNSGATVFGHDYNFVKEDYAELTGYKAIKITGTPGMAIRVIYNCTRNKIGDSTEENSIQQEKVVTLDEDGVGILDEINEYVYFHLHGMKVQWGSSGSVDNVELISDERVDYVLEGNGTLSKNDADVLSYENGGKNANIGTCAMDAINDVGARVIDARPRVSISRVALAYPGNPNCLILMRENLSRKQHTRVQFDTPVKDGVNANMVKIGGLPSDPDYNNDRSVSFNITGFTADEINLFDGYSFSAPRKVTVNGTSTLTRQTTANKINTLILPFASDDVKGTAYETFKSKYAEFDVEKQGILNDVDIKAGDHVLLFDVKGKSVDAYTPYLYVANETSDNTVIEGTGDIEQTPEVGTDKAPGEYMTNNRPADEEDRHYLRGFMESTHVEDIYGYKADGTLVRAKNATMTPFRVIIQAPIDINEDYQNNIQPTGNVKIVLYSDFDDDTPTEIKTVDAINMESIVDVYSANGALVRKNVKAIDALNNLPKGVYVVGGKKVVK